jgi:hypothetical protein
LKKLWSVHLPILLWVTVFFFFGVYFFVLTVYSGY